MAKQKLANKRAPKASTTTKPSPSSSSSSKRRKLRGCKSSKEEVVPEIHENVEETSSMQVETDEIDDLAGEESPASPEHKRRVATSDDDLDCRFIGEPVPLEEAEKRWPHRYVQKNGKGSSLKLSDDEEFVMAKCHYLKAEVDGSTIYELNDDAHVKSEDGALPYICKITEFFEGVDGVAYFRAKWYYRSCDTVIKESILLREEKRIFPSEIHDDNPVNCLLEKLNIVRVTPNLDLPSKKNCIPNCDYYYDMVYLLPYSTFMVPPLETAAGRSESQSTISGEVDSDSKSDCDEVHKVVESNKSEMTLLDLYSGCGAMSTGLCLGANLSQTNLVTRWAVDINEHACETLALNHPHTKVRNESVDSFLLLLKEWEKLCATFSLIESEITNDIVDGMGAEDEDDNDAEGGTDGEDDEEVFEVERIVGICHGDPKESGEPGLHFKVKWKGYGPDADSWEPVGGLGNCRESIGEFVRRGHAEKLLPLPGDVDVVCGGPPCQGISGFNRFRNKENPLADPKNEQLKVFMDVVDYLKPKYVLMENVVDLVKFASGFLGRYALGRLVDMNYQTRMGMMAAGAYGLPQFRMRVFIWGAQPSEKLPQYPLPTHDLVLRGVIPTEFEINTVAYNEGHDAQLENKLFLGDAISDLPEVKNNECRDEMPYGDSPQTEFQRFIRLKKDAMLESTAGSDFISTLYDHRPLKLNQDDFDRVCHIPKRKGANFRDLAGVRVRLDNKVEWDPDVKRVLLASGKPLVPDYAMSFVKGSSTKPFGRLWWDETVPTVVTRAEPHNQCILHPLQDRVLTIRENARLQGFPDYYQLKGPVKERYIQVGNAVAVPVSRALGYALSMAVKGIWNDEPLLTLPPRFPCVHERGSSPEVDNE